MFPLKDTIPSSTFPFVTISIIVTNIFIFIYQLSLGPQLNEFFNHFGVIPVKFTSVASENPVQLIPLSATLFSSVFLHGGWMHIIGNMWYLWIFGDNIEDRTGHFRFLLFYLLCGIAAGLVHIIMNPGSGVPTIGASGAIAGVMGAYILLFPNSRVITLIFVIFFIQIVEIPAIFFLGFWIIIQIISGSMQAGLTEQSGGVAWWAHIGGFFIGLLLVLFFKKRKSRK
ncbi:MAG: rhomboid family intramembrane serine protease [Calditrichaeota bacterium]|nr:rhomboid family intramembrane serine protease [Calditrichota bacterium]RQV99650.1 MAG: rhomboid family intramembrane serine protease [Calditrichota bacterium]